jgi:hypothetical protein
VGDAHAGHGSDPTQVDLGRGPGLPIQTEMPGLRLVSANNRLPNGTPGASHFRAMMESAPEKTPPTQAHRVP